MDVFRQILSKLIHSASVTRKEFYKNKAVVKEEWWLSYACEYPNLLWARLRVFADGSADAAFDEDKIYGFDKEESAEFFLSEDEYIRFDLMDDEDREFIGALGVELLPPVWTEDNFLYFKHIGEYPKWNK